MQKMPLAGEDHRHAQFVGAGEAFEVVQSTTIAALVESLGERPERLAIEHNGLIVSRALWSSTELRKGDQVEIVQFVGGGNT